MNQLPPPRGNSDSIVFQAVQEACRQFEQGWHKNQDFRIEDTVDKIKTIIRSIRDPSIRRRASTEILTELIHIEMELRFRADQQISGLDYYRRFPDFRDTIDKAWSRLIDPDVETGFGHANILRAILSNADGSAASIDPQGHTGIPPELGVYQNVEQLKNGVGGFGIVCKAFDTVRNEWVALKFPHKDVVKNEDQLNQFYDEANNAAKLDQPGIVKTYKIEEIDEYICIVQQFIAGKTLREFIDDSPDPFSVKEAVELVLKIARSLSYAHHADIIHRDIKPSNILIDENGTTFIGDFGLSLNLKDRAYSKNQICGSISYMAPEQLAGVIKDIDERSDIWSLGVIFYELLTNECPFEGLTPYETAHQIISTDPRPVRAVNSGIDRVIQRICHKCLSRSKIDRYQTLDILIEDLEKWEVEGEYGDQVDFVPKGLRSYGPEDAHFFLDLIPGVRDRLGVPDCLQFWLDRINRPVAPENQIPVGVIYGPSGSGKSSFVKAGLIPRLKNVQTIYLEATQDDTEVRLLKALKRHFPQIALEPDPLALPAIMEGLANGEWQTSDNKILIIIDQFEQRLSQGDEFGKSQLSQSLRFCDGNRIQSLLMVRDDFWIKMTRFLDGLETDLQVGQNAQAIDLFGKEHAKKVLVQLGQAYGKLPSSRDQFTKRQKQFLDTAIDQLSDGGMIVCIHLTLFAQMFDAKEWTVAELNSAGGVQGVGERFLESTFRSDSAQKRHKNLRESAARVLSALLPDEASDIRGGMKTEDQLRNAAQCESRPEHFRDLLRVLDQELRLITRTDPDSPSASDVEIDEDRDGEKFKYFQLTHDYLVPSIRDWLSHINNETAKGRAQTRLKSLARSWSLDQNKRFLPGFFEHLSIWWRLDKRSFSQTEKSLFKSSRNFYTFWTLAWTLVIGSLLGSIFYMKGVKDQEIAESNVQTFINCAPDIARHYVNPMRDYRRRSLKLLKQKLNAAEEEIVLRACIGIGLLGDRDQTACEKLVDCISPEFDDEGQNIAAACQEVSDIAVPALVRKLEEVESDYDLYLQKSGDQPEAVANAIQPRKLGRLAVVVTCLNQTEIAEKLLGQESKQEHRAEFIASFSKWLDRKYENEAFLEKPKSDAMKAAICKALGLQGKERKGWWKQNRAKIDKCWAGSTVESLLPELVKWANIRAGEKTQNLVRKFISFEPNLDFQLRVLNANGKEVVIESPIRKRYFILDREVSVGEFKEFLNDPDAEKPLIEEFPELDNLPNSHPVQSISFIDAILYCNWLSKKKGLTPCYTRVSEMYQLPPMADGVRDFYMKNVVKNRLNRWQLEKDADGFRLPTHAEWENACGFRQWNDNSFDIFCTHDISDGETTLPCKAKPPNEFGVYEMQGNVAEYCWNSQLILKKIDVKNPRNTVALRGGSKESTSSSIRRGGLITRSPYERFHFTGFRIVCVKPEQKEKEQPASDDE